MVYKKVLSELDKMVVRKLVGAASVCWENIEGTGRYDADKAEQLASDFCDYLVGVKRVDKSG